MRPELEQLFQRHYDLLCATAAHVLLDASSAEDVVQEAFVRAAARGSLPGGEVVPLAYVRRIVINRAIDVARQRQTARKYLPFHAKSAKVADTYFADEIDADLFHALELLPPRQRACVVLRYVYDLSIHEVAHELGITAGTVKSQTSRALETLRLTLIEKERSQHG